MEVKLRQKALTLDQEFQLHICEREIPRPHAGEVSIRVTAAALNPGDWKVKQWGIKIEGQPVIPGMDMAGTVVEVGEDVIGFQKGDRVITMGTWTPESSSFQQYARATAKFVTKVPDHISDEEAASIPVGVLAAWIGLYNNPYGAGYPHPFSNTRGEIMPLLVLGGSSSVGQYVLQFARLSKFFPIVTTASVHHETYLKSLGATHVLNRQLADEDIMANIRKITNRSFPIVFDAISSAETKRLGYAMVAREGKLLTVDTRFGDFTRPIGEKLTFNPDLEHPKCIVNVRGVTIDPDTATMAELLFANLNRLLQDGSIVPNRVEVLSNGLLGVPEGLVRLESGSISGVKLVVRPQEMIL